MKKKLGRPRKKEGAISFAAFLRAGIVMTLYDEARKDGQKHSAAVAQAVELIKLRDPAMRISETEVKRNLARWRPHGSRTILHLECTMLSEEELARLYCTAPPIAAISQEKGSNLAPPSNVNRPRSVTHYKMYLGKRPNYPRHNQKLPKK